MLLPRGVGWCAGWGTLHQPALQKRRGRCSPSRGRLQPWRGSAGCQGWLHGWAGPWGASWGSARPGVGKAGSVIKVLAQESKGLAREAVLPPLHCHQAVLVRPAWGGQQIQGLCGFIPSAPAGALRLTLVAEAGRAQPCMSPKAQKWLVKGGKGALRAPTSLPGGRWDAPLLQKWFYLYSERLCHALCFL